MIFILNFMFTYPLIQKAHMPDTMLYYEDTMADKREMVSSIKEFVVW